MFGSWEKYTQSKEDMQALKVMLTNKKFPSGRSLRVLSLGVGRSTSETIELLKKLNARPVLLKNRVQGYTLRPKTKKR